MKKSIGTFLILFSCGLLIACGGDKKEKTAADVISAFKEFKRMMDKYDVCQYKAVATSALREARNGNRLVAEIMRTSQIRVQIIDGIEEARLVQLAISRHFKARQISALIVDIGGGSVEVIVSYKGKIKGIESLRLGTVRLLQDFNPDQDFDQMHSKIKQIIGRFFQKLSLPFDLHQLKLMVTGGNARCLGRLGMQFLGTSSPEFLTDSEVASVLTLLHSLSHQARREELGLKTDRADVILPAALIIYELMVFGGFKSLLIPPVGLKNGVLYDMKRVTN